MGREILTSKIAEGKHYKELTRRLEPDGCLPATPTKGSVWNTDYKKVRGN